jgi:hypothetical protein
VCVLISDYASYARIRITRTAETIQWVKQGCIVSLETPDNNYGSDLDLLARLMNVTIISSDIVPGVFNVIEHWETFGEKVQHTFGPFKTAWLGCGGIVYPGRSEVLPLETLSQFAYAGGAEVICWCPTLSTDTSRFILHAAEMARLRYKEPLIPINYLVESTPSSVWL